MKTKELKCDICEEKAVYRICKLKDLRALVCDNQFCLDELQDTLGECNCNFDKILKELNQPPIK